MSLLLISRSDDLIVYNSCVLVVDSYLIFVKYLLLGCLVFAHLLLLILEMVRLLDLCTRVDDTSIRVFLVLWLTNDEGQFDTSSDTQESRRLGLLLHLDLCA